MQERSCAMVVVGNEILSGKVQDTNAFFAARELRKIGVALNRIAVVSDELKAIGDEVAGCARSHDFVITSGGVGPTHDDITIEAVAIAFKRKLIVHPELEQLIRAHFKENIATGMKMALAPEGSVLNSSGDLRFPTIQLENVYILPGIPQIFERKLAGLIGRFSADPYFLRAIYTRIGEGVLAGYLNACLKHYPNLLLGSYPRIGEPEYRVKLTLESKDRDYLDRAFANLMESLPAGAVVKVE
jgi:molybdenum cofactor synthesis domain-containing protein